MLDAGTGVHPCIREAFADARIAADVIQVPVRVDDGRDPTQILLDERQDAVDLEQRSRRQLRWTRTLCLLSVS